MSPLFFILSVAVGLLILGLLVFIHELGHFLAAKACKIRVSAFALGFGKPIVAWTRGETEYRINRIPFGGYVAMASDSPIGETAGGDNEFNSHPIWQRALVAIAGPAANLIAAIAMLWVMFMVGVDRPLYMDSTVIRFVSPNSAADSAGFKGGDSIVAINGKSVDKWDDVEMLLVQQFKSGYEIDIVRNGVPLTLSLHIERTGAKISRSPTGGLHARILPPVIGRVTKDGPAHDILAAGDTIISINETPVHTFNHLSYMIYEVRHIKGRVTPISMRVKRGESILDTIVIPKFNPEHKRFMLGIEAVPEPTRVMRYDPISAFRPTMKRTWEYTTMIFDVLGNLVSGEAQVEQLSGPLNVIPVSGMMAFQGFTTILNFMAMIGINLALLNLLPLVITDGGLLMFLGIEAIRGKPLPVNVQMTINKIFIAFFLALFLFITFNDTLKLFDIFKMFR